MSKFYFLARSLKKKFCSTSQIPARIVLSFVKVSMSLELKRKKVKKQKRWH